MPTYTYECQKCGADQDEFHMMTATPVIKCLSCGSPRMRKLLGTGAGIIFKGSGFYETDYKRNGKDAGSEKSGAGASKSESKTEGASTKAGGDTSSSAKPAAAGASTKAAANG